MRSGICSGLQIQEERSQTKYLLARGGREQVAGGFLCCPCLGRRCFDEEGEGRDTNCSITEKLCLPCAALNLSCPQKSATKGFTGLAAKQKDFNPP